MKSLLEIYGEVFQGYVEYLEKRINTLKKNEKIYKNYINSNPGSCDVDTLHNLTLCLSEQTVLINLLLIIEKQIKEKRNNES